MFKTLITIFFTAIGFIGYAQIKCSSAEIIVLSRHVWRGAELGTAPAIEPSVTFAKGRFALNLWAAGTTNNSYSEIDVIPSFQMGEITLSALDYYTPVVGEKNRFFNFKKGESRHSLELTIDNYLGDKRRLKWLVGTMVAGDKNEETGNPLFSTYLELKYPFTFHIIDIEPFVGITPFKGMYATQFAVINTGIAISKSFAISPKLSIPVSITYFNNPNLKTQIVTFGSGIAFSSE